MRIVDVSAFYSPHGGGVRTYVDQKLAIAPALGHDLTVIVPGDIDAVDERGPHARLVSVASPRLAVDRKYWYFDDEPALHAAIDRARPDMLEASSPWRSATMVARWPGRAPRALVMHADPLSAYAYRWLEPLFRRETIDRGFEPFWSHLRELGDAFQQVVCASADLRGRLTAGGVAHCVLRPMGVEGNLFGPERRDPAVRARLLELCDLDADAHLLLGIGRLSPEKRWLLAIEAVMLASQHRPIGFVILGEGRQRDRLRREIGGNPHIRILNPERDRQRFATLLASADAVLHACEAETFCLVAAEARASGVPVIVPDRGGAADHAASGAGLTYAAGKAQAAADAIERFIAHPFRPPAKAVVTMRDHFAELFASYETLVVQQDMAA